MAGCGIPPRRLARVRSSRSRRTSTANGGDPIFTFNAFLIAYGGKDLVTPDGRLHTDDPQVRAAAARAIERLTTPFKEGYVPPGCVNWNDADDNNAFTPS